MSSPQAEGAKISAEDRLGRWIESYLGGCSAAILFILMLLTFVDVVGRDALNAPIPGGFEITQILMAALFFTAIPVVSWRGEHVVVDLFDGVTPPAIAKLKQVAITLMAALSMGVVAWQCWVLGVDLDQSNQVTEYLAIPVGPVLIFIAVMSAVTTVLLTINAGRYLSGHLSVRSGGFS
jgi:TRAP-type C4-dicarboxylate transport system permease small subunit